jgi:XTP/dITP diphosphohydrolase
MTRLLIATHNADKVKEINGILAGLSIELVPLNTFPNVPPTVEDADSLEGNALKKAEEAFRATGIPSAADDTGLEVFYLNDAPGVWSSRYAGEGATYAGNRQKLLKNLRGVPPRRRTARFRTVVAFVPSAGKAHLFEGICPGTIIEHERGAGGFGYDAIFLPEGYDETFGEMALDKKNTLSHRARAFQKFAEFLRSGAAW